MHAQFSRKTWIAWWTRVALALTIILVAAMWEAVTIAKSNLRKHNPAPGQMIDVGGYRMHIYCVGTGSPTVILDAGISDFFVSWSRTQPEVSKFTRVCSYDRAGLGWSEASSRPRTNEVMVDELHTLLTIAGIGGPYVLAGHSFGGINMRLFARMYPKEVAGLVLVDSAHEQQNARIPFLHKGTDQLLGQFQTLSAMSSMGLIAWVPQYIPHRSLPPEAYAQYQAVLATTDFFAGAIAEGSVFYSSAGNAPASLGDLPLIVLSRGKTEPAPELTYPEQTQLEQEWQKMQLELVNLSTNSRQIIATRSDHYIQLEQPALVIYAIQEIVQAARK